MNYEPLASGGPKNDVGVRYHIPTDSGSVTMHFYVSGNVQLIRLTPTSHYPDSDGFVKLKIKTSNGWYESPVSSLSGSIDWKKGIEVVFEYPEGKVLRKLTADKVSINSRYLGIHPVTNWGCPPIEGDIFKIRLMRNDDNSIDFFVERTTGLKHGGHGGRLVGKVEILISSE